MTRALHLDPSRVRAIAGRFAEQRIVVLGDLMLDRFIWGAVRRISPEAPVPVVEVERESQHLGGAGNVVANVVALGGHSRPVGVTGDDANADLLRAEFRLAGVDTDSVVRDASRPTTTKTRIIAHSQQVVRADRESRQPVATQVSELLLEAFGRAIADASAVVVSDYDKGLLGGDVLARALSMAAERSVPVCLDPKVRRFRQYSPVTVVTPNHHEAEAAAGLAAGSDDEIETCGRRLQEILGGPAVLITRGEAGMTLVDSDGSAVHVPTMALEVYDVTGAGDTVIATLALALAAGASMREAAVLSNIAAGVVVGKVGTATLTTEELIEAADAAHARD